MDIFETKGIKPMPISEQQEPFNDKNYIYELKLDGIRCIAYLDKDSTDLRNKKNIKLLPSFPELKNLNKYVNEKCILDGELIVTDKEGKPDFYEMQRRTLLTNSFKINLASKTRPVSFVVYDIIYLKDKLINDLELMERKKKLQSILISENEKFSTSRYVDEKGIELFELSKQQGLEGVIAKKKDSKYRFDKRTKDWIKFKNMADDDFIICGYMFEENNMTSFILGKYDEEELVFTGHITLGASLKALQKYNYTMIDKCPFNMVPPKHENARWIKPELVCRVEYMQTDKDTMRQPVFKGIREDKAPHECKI